MKVCYIKIFSFVVFLLGINFLTLGALPEIGSPISRLTRLRFPMSLSWQFNQENLSSYQGYMSLSSDKKVVYYAIGQSIFALDAETGNMLWKFPETQTTKGFFIYPPVYKRGLVIGTTSANEIYALIEKTGKVLWGTLTTYAVYAPPMAIGAFLVVPLADSSFHAYYLKNGLPAYKNPTRIFEGSWGKPSTTDRYLFYFTKQNKMFGYQVPQRTELWHTQLTQLAPDVKPVPEGSSLFVIEGPRLNSYKALSGAKKWQIDLAQPPIGNPVASNEGVAMATKLGKIYLFNLDGTLKLNEPIKIDWINGVSMCWIGHHVAVLDGRQVLSVYNDFSGKLEWSMNLLPLAPALKENFGSSPQLKMTVAPMTDGQRLFVSVPGRGLLAFSGTNVSDTTPPVIKMIYPNPGDELSPNAKIVFRIWDIGSGVNPYSIKVLLGRAELKYKYDATGMLEVNFGGNSGNKSLPEGRSTVKVQVSDWFDNKQDTDFQLNVSSKVSSLSNKISSEEKAFEEAEQ